MLGKQAEFLKQTALTMLGQKTDNFRKSVWEVVFSLRSYILRSFLLLVLITQLVLVSLLTYTTFYYTYIPRTSHIIPVNLQFNGCGKERGICSYPSANTSLLQTYNEYRLAKGQNYRIVLNLDMPESEVNNRLGMFMVHVKTQNKNGENLQSSSVSSMLHFKSNLLSQLTAITLLPLFLFLGWEEKQIISVELFSKYSEGINERMAFLHTVIESRNIEIYSADISITAEFSGLRYLMFYHPIFSTVVGSLIIFVFLTMIFSAAWHNFNLEQTVHKMDDYLEKLAIDAKPTNDENEDDVSVYSAVYVPPKKNSEDFHRKGDERLETREEEKSVKPARPTKLDLKEPEELHWQRIENLDIKNMEDVKKNE